MPKKIATDLSEEMKSAIDNYGSLIKTLEDHVKAVRMMPGNFGGGVGNSGFLDMIREIFQNAIDQILSNSSPADWASIKYDMRTLVTEVWDNGSGLPYDDMIRILTVPNTSKNYQKAKGEYSSGRHGSGCKTVNALSSKLIAESYKYDGTAARITTIEGYPSTDKPEPIPNKDKYQGTMIRFEPSLEVMGNIDLDWKVVYKLVRQIVNRTAIGTVCDFEAIDLEGVSHKEHIINKDGIIGDLIEKTTSPMCKPIMIFKDTGEMKLEASFVFDGGGADGPSSQEIVTAFCNFCPCPVGTHIEGTVTGICKWFVKYMNTIYLKNATANSKSKKQVTCQASDIKTGLVLSISAAMLFPHFIGQNKEQLANTEMVQFCSDTVSEVLDNWAKTNPQDLSRLCRYFKDVAELRMKESNEKAKIVSKYVSNVFGMPRKYRKPTKEKKEFIIVEGDSAGGSVYNARNSYIQGYFPIRGKMPNAFRTPRNKFLENEEVQALIKIILGKDPKDVPKRGPIVFDPQDIDWDKIILMSDADIDGAHIDALLLRFIILYMPQLIQAGKLYRAVPPLYSITKKGGNGKEQVYFTENIDFVRYVQKIFVKTNELTTLKGESISNKDMSTFFLKNADYTYWVDSLSKTYAVEPELFEMALFAYYNKTTVPALRKELVKKYRFMEVSQNKDTVIFEGIINDSNTLFLNDRFVSDCSNALDIIDKNNGGFYYKMNGEVRSIYEIMKAFEATQPNHLNRYKGLGEMLPEQIAVSTLLPDSDRTLIRYTMDDVKETIAIINDYESDFTKLFKFVGEVTRQDLMD